ncbi:PspC domain-containing protein [Beggiatoa leptomitoformis]|uniref:PspC domain-containing protein n=1 Tax=Beggiatoa leptomitoformis TaxID=288004 RepID=A0A2N9YDP0_9GAMM|nr:PspC domain-containing protein [Beggiatoa leptomitoformis]ALG69107.1 PspC domain-containing protein [Beggiatoa leptomitoformis]AUI68479.1 PspC domain-containing protein [Beggiatoa leptomitoformis]
MSNPNPNEEDKWSFDAFVRKEAEKQATKTAQSSPLAAARNGYLKRKDKVSTPKESMLDEFDEFDETEPTPKTLNTDNKTNLYKGLYKNTQQKWIFGVCAGFADYSGISVAFFRIMTVFCTMFFPFTFFIYLGLAFFLPTRPDAANADVKNAISPEDTAFMQRLPELLAKLDAVVSLTDQKTRRIEHYVTSDTFSLQRKIWDLQRKS